MIAQHHLDIAGMEAPAALSVIAKATRYMSRGTTVAVSVPDPDLAAEVEAWAAWSGHGSHADVQHHTITVLVREGERLLD